MMIDLTKIAVFYRIRPKLYSYIREYIEAQTLTNNILYIMKKFLSVIAVVAVFTVVLPSCSQSDDFDDVVVNQIEEQAADGTSDYEEGEKPGI